MNPAFRFDILAQDKASAAVNKINARLQTLSRPSRELRDSLGALGRNSGLDAVARSVGRIGGAALDAAKRVASMVPAIGALAGVGTVAGIAALVNSVGRTAVATDNLAARLGMGAREMRTFEVAGRLVGLSAETTTGALDSLANTIEQASTGVNVEAANHMRQLGMEIKRLPNGSIDAIAMLKQLADVVKRLPNAQAQQTVAGAFGVTEMLPLLRRGSAGIDELQRKAGTFAAVLDGPGMAAGYAYNEQLVRLEQATERLKLSLGVALLPAVNDVAAAVTRLTDKYGAMVAQKVGEYVQRIGRAMAEAGPYVDKLLELWNGEGGKRARQFVAGEAPKFDVTSPIDSAKRMKQFYGGERVDAKNLVGAREHLGNLEREFGLPTGLLDFVWNRESSRGRNMLSPAGAQGHFGFMPGTQQEMGLKDPNDFGQSSKAAAEYLRRLMKMNGGDIDRTLAGYNWGQGNVDRKGLAQAPKETRDYIEAWRRAVTAGSSAAQVASGANPGTSGTVTIKLDIAGSGAERARVSTSASAGVDVEVRKVGRSAFPDPTL